MPTVKKHTSQSLWSDLASVFQPRKPCSCFIMYRHLKKEFTHSLFSSWSDTLDMSKDQCNIFIVTFNDLETPGELCVFVGERCCQSLFMAGLQLVFSGIYHHVWYNGKPSTVANWIKHLSPVTWMDNTLCKWLLLMGFWWRAPSSCAWKYAWHHLNRRTRCFLSLSGDIFCFFSWMQFDR